MAFDAHVNFAYATVATAPSPASSGTSLTLSAGAGAGFPAVPFNATVWPTGVIALATNAEIIRVTARAGDVLTIARAAEPPSPARAIVVGDQVAATITAKTLTDAEGPVADTRLSANVALLNAANVFTQNQLVSAARAELQVLSTGDTTKGRVMAPNPTANLVLSQNISFNGQWMRDDITKLGVVITLSNGEISFFTVATGANPATPVLVFKIAATGDVSFPGSLTTGTVPDARLSANIPRLDATTNVFLGWQEVRSVGGTQGRFMWRDTTMPANQQLWEMALSGGLMYVLPLTDSGVTTGAPGPLVLSPTGDVLVGRDLTEKGRTTPLGHWTSAALGSYLTGFTGSYSYSYIGKTMLLTVFGSATLGASVASLTLLFPSGVTAAFACIPVIAGAVGSGWSGGVAYVAGPGATSCDLYLVQNAPWPAGAVQVALSISIPIQ